MPESNLGNVAVVVRCFTTDSASLGVSWSSRK